MMVRLSEAYLIDDQLLLFPSIPFSALMCDYVAVMLTISKIHRECGTEVASSYKSRTYRSLQGTVDGFTHPD